MGEGLQARAVLEALRTRRPDVQAIFTHFSPSAEALARDMPVACADYLPWDVPSAVAPLLDALRPDVVAFTKTEVWPVVVWEAARRGIPTAMIAGSCVKILKKLNYWAWVRYQSLPPNNYFPSTPACAAVAVRRPARLRSVVWHTRRASLSKPCGR